VVRWITPISAPKDFADFLRGSKLFITESIISLCATIASFLKG